ncbi:hypothetical protein [Psychromarinibacter halotolerans]|uniref:hypothetical protein n=1 Tax=Psychromarinibacter halotolerans TaxID=1775175 RepID=UPI0036D3666E
MTTLVIWTALPPGPARAMALSALCCDHHVQLNSVDNEASTHHGKPDSGHAQICENYCILVDALRMPVLSAGVTGRVWRVTAPSEEATHASREIAPSSPPPRA